LLAECRASIAAAKAEAQQLIAVTDRRTVDNTFERYNEAGRHLQNSLQLGDLMSQVHPDPQVREAMRTCQAEASAYSSELSLDRRIYDALAAVDVSAADASTKRFATLVLRDYRRAGVTLDDTRRARLRVLDDEATKLAVEISKNIAEDTRFIAVTDRARLAGLPADWVAHHQPDATGVIKITTDYPDYLPFLTYADDDALRKELYVKAASRGDQHNERLLQQLFTRRAERAKLLGFANWADYISDDKMLKGGKAAQQFIDRVAGLAKARGQRDYQELLAQLRKSAPRATAVQAWQKTYVENQVKKEKYAVDDTLVRQYFPFASTLRGLLDITSAMYDIQYRPVTDARPWHADVQVFDVMRGAEKLGRVYLDLHPRPDKYKHAAQFGLKDGVLGKQLPEGALVCNFPAGDQLMEHADVVTMFHEFGHLMHHVLGGKHRWIRLSGVATEQDFVEAPSQMFEEWARSYETLSRFARRADGQVIPRELVDKMRKAEAFGVGTRTSQQMFYAAISLQFHQADPAKLDQLALLQKLQARYTPFAYVPGTRMHTAFGHLVGYSSMYYTYMWSLVIAKDLLAPFDKAGSLLDPETAHAYRDAILAAGATKDAAALVKDFLGRDYDFKAFERYLSAN